MREPDRPAGGVRRCGASDLARVRLIKSAQRPGLGLDEVAYLLRLEDGSHCTEARAQAERRHGDVRGRLAVLRRIEAALHDAVQRCWAADGEVRCPMIRALQEA